MLLLLDNFEQVMDAAEGVADLLQRCAELKVLVTSREALRVRGEHLLAVPPLLVPTVAPNGPRPSRRCVRAVAAVPRAGPRSPSELQLTDDNAAAVAEISARLDGLPLAIELAAARLQLFSPDELRDRLRSRLELLGRGPRDLPARQRTLRSTIEWSYELLDEEERPIFRLLAVFSPTRSKRSRRSSAGWALADVDVVDRLTSLVDKSLVRSVETRGSQRLSMLETIREYAAERLDEMPELAARRARARRVLRGLRPGANGRLYGRERGETLDELESELGNLLTAWRHWVAAGDLEQLEKLLDGLWVLDDARGWYHATVELTNDLLGVLAPFLRRRNALRGDHAVHRASPEASWRSAATRRRWRRPTSGRSSSRTKRGELPRRFPVLRSLASFHLSRGEFDKAAAVGGELLALAEQQNDASLPGGRQLVVARASPSEATSDRPRSPRSSHRSLRPDQHQPGPFASGPAPASCPIRRRPFSSGCSGNPKPPSSWPRGPSSSRSS